MYPRVIFLKYGWMTVTHFVFGIKKLVHDNFSIYEWNSMKLMIS